MQSFAITRLPARPPHEVKSPHISPHSQAAPDQNDIRMTRPHGRPEVHHPQSLGRHVKRRSFRPTEFTVDLLSGLGEGTLSLLNAFAHVLEQTVPLLL